MFTPQIHLSIHSEYHSSSHRHYSADFTVPVINGRRPTLEQMSVPSLGEIPSEYDKSLQQHTGNMRYIVVHRDNEWHLAKANIQWFSQGGNRIHVHHDDEHVIDKMAFPVDPRMIAEDIEGATNLYPNETNDGWLFVHASQGHHEDHELNLMAAIDGLFQPVLRQYQVDALAGASAEIKTNGAERFALAATFYGEVIGLARTNART